MTKNIFGILFVGVLVASAQATQGLKLNLRPERIPGELVVRFKGVQPGYSIQSQAISSLRTKLGARSILQVRQLTMDPALHVVRLSDDRAIVAAAQELGSNPQVEIVEPNYIYRANNLPNDTDFSKLWGLNNTGQKDEAGQDGVAGADIGVTAVWNKGIQGSASILVAIIDTGVDRTHPDLVPNMYTNPREIPDNGVDDDSNGFVDDVYGWNFNKRNNNPMDDHGHGTHVAGTIGAVGNNNVGVTGVNWKTSIVGIKFLGGDGSGSLADAVDSIKYATKIGAKMSNNSWGGGGYSETMKNAIQEAHDAGVLFIAAAGNDTADNDSGAHYPSNYQVPNVISVAATDNQDKLAYFSNWGGQTVHLAAPGHKILSTVLKGGYAVYSGTSMATPHVTGAAALLWSAFPDLKPEEVKDRLLKTVAPIRSLSRKTISGGRLMLANAVENFVPPQFKPNPQQWVDVATSVVSASPLPNNHKEEFVIEHPGAKFIRVHFRWVDTEAKYDTIQILDGQGAEVDLISGKKENYWSDYAEGSKMTLKVKTDDSVQSRGFEITVYSHQ